jgi:hypothetical protein
MLSSYELCWTPSGGPLAGGLAVGEVRMGRIGAVE